MPSISQIGQSGLCHRRPFFIQPGSHTLWAEQQTGSLAVHTLMLFWSAAQQSPSGQRRHQSMDLSTQRLSTCNCTMNSYALPVAFPASTSCRLHNALRTCHIINKCTSSIRFDHQIPFQFDQPVQIAGSTARCAPATSSTRARAPIDFDHQIHFKSITLSASPAHVSCRVSSVMCTWATTTKIGIKSKMFLQVDCHVFFDFDQGCFLPCLC